MNPLSMWTSFRSTVQAYSGIAGSRFIGIIWICAICGVIWIFGPRLSLGGTAPLAEARPRLILMALVVVIYLLWMVVSRLRRRRAAKTLDDAVTETAEDRAAAETQAEITELRSRLKDALKTMRRITRRRFGSAYEYPWYLMMGAPGAGKTTLLTNSGLKFPLGDAMHAEPVQGVGGTRNCNWWFTDRAILIDTAGRYTTQDTGQQRDAKGFLGFLKMLRRSRRQQPINGVVLTLSLTDVLTQSPEDRLREVRAIRQRLSEIEETLGARVPVYLVLTKADKLTGFPRFFDSLGAQARGQVWGITFPLEEAQTAGALPGIFSREFQALLARLNAMLVERLQQETDIDQRGRIFRFPAQVSALHDALREVVEELASGSDRVAEPLIRGVYFASATQDEPLTPPRSASGIPIPASAMNRSYFVDRLFSDVILKEAALVSRDTQVERRQRVATGLGYGLAACLTLFLIGAWGSGYSFNRTALASVDTRLTDYANLARNIPVRDVADTDFLRVLPALNLLAQSPAAFEDADSALPLHRAGFGMDRSARISKEHAQAYSNALGAYLLPRYMVALQNQLREEDLTEAQAFEALKHYLSLGGLGPTDPDGLLAHAETVFAGLYPGTGRAPTREALITHLAAMLERGTLPVLQIDETLVAQTRARIETLSPARRVLDLMAARQIARALPNWSVQRAIGPAARTIFDASATPIDGLLTRRGYISVVLPQIMAMAETASQEGWVRGPGGRITDTPSEIAAQAIELYWADYMVAWRGAISAITIREVSSLAEAAELVSQVNSPAKPLSRLAASIAQEADLASLPADVSSAALPFDPQTAPDPFGPLRRAMAETGETEEDQPLAALTPILDQVYQELTRLDTRDPVAAQMLASETALSDASQALVAEGRQLSRPVDTWVVSLAARVSDAAVGQARVAADALWKAKGVDVCRAAVEDRYPFSRAARIDVTMTDFTRVFGPDGLFDSFFDANLAGFVDTSRDVWTWRGGLGLDDADSSALRQFQRADAIQRAFFPNGATAPRIDLDIDLLSLGAGANVVVIDMGNMRTTHRRDLSDNKVLAWPNDGSAQARILLLPQDRRTALVTTGPWAPFRLFDQGDPRPVADNQFDVSFVVDDRKVDLRVTSGSVLNPFRLPALAAFRCPTGF
ncbi:type VI secretion protein IcmF [Roseobacter cerasinus]|uniref:Type VI secretion protein IcmF n=1 Tax=Roseobacter cerasinus TaxID=2602289 RepID=A0A640VRR8_9RHOB|nr:type VI secretion system membrane subunit TssM [Roseobacter cerasinus]GFE50903.1 type VI secretion protein IcmF [Roseobacter cerasinus]